MAILRLMAMAKILENENKTKKETGGQARGAGEARRFDSAQAETIGNDHSGSHQTIGFAPPSEDASVLQIWAPSYSFHFISLHSKLCCSLEALMRMRSDS